MIERKRESFNPRPALGPGATFMINSQKTVSKRFNPRPALGPGATVQLQLDHTTKNFFVNARTG
ncbi:MAG: hypothetical protein DYH15_10345 [Nitrosomonas sp. PRO4]|nr:hypothetical protein [Nitrosomonas sp. PRO4]